MDRRYKPLAPAETLAARRALTEELAAEPATPIPVVVRKIRTALRLTIAEYAKLCGVSARALADIERDVTSPTLVTVEKLLRPMGLRAGAVSVTGSAAARVQPSTLPAPQERSRINVEEPWEVNYWCKELGVSEAELRAAVKAAGTPVAAVRRQLGK